MNKVTLQRRVNKLGIIISLILLTACNEAAISNTATVTIPNVMTQPLNASSSYLQQQRYTGIVRSSDTTAIGFELAGKLSDIVVDSGDSVIKGQQLAKLNTQLLQAEQQQLAASLLQTQADLDLAQSNFNRSVKLKKKQYVSQQQFDESQQQVASLQANQKRLQASLHATELKLAKSTLVAPFDGNISKRHHNIGEVIALGSPVFTLIGNNQQQAYIGVPNTVAMTMQTNQSVNITVGNQTYTGTIAGISAEIDAVTRTVQLRVDLPNNSRMINGEIAYLEYQQQVNSAGYWVPISALTDGMRGLWNVFVVTKNADGQAQLERRDVDIIYTNQQQAFINGAIDKNDVIVTQGLHKLVVGQIVSPSSQTVARSL
ncbi:efflux RND transporter periplasmic adaptor subunit [Shewanella sp. 3_MG-2023]|uniref:efflux RND transporter periplasmic adaptor subunit n=1 Tax=Shewanella sp. 3_MG-2023 TaxID=3062635 RepID=UPI0026E4620B|nr:efflux RND transporter periplasmic adaptor subunit [Shewanella sp. 3_MG-2023]MDO6774794.1 efflux RND transporter periplasmic adaptor subunit [Shewanella sp. 3_MG-2023]